MDMNLEPRPPSNAPVPAARDPKACAYRSIDLCKGDEQWKQRQVLEQFESTGKH